MRARIILAAVAATVIVLGLGAPTVTAQTYAPPGPGLGTSTADPAGLPVSLVLPPGYTRERIRGGWSDAYLDDCLDFDPENVPQACEDAVGAFEVTLVMTFDPVRYQEGVDDNFGSCAEDSLGWDGWVLVAADDAAQNIMVPIGSCLLRNGAVTPTVRFPTPSDEVLAAGVPVVVEYTFSGYCLNLDREIPDEQHTYLPGVLTQDDGLLDIVDAIDGANLYIIESRELVQDIIWNYTEGPGLTEEDLDELWFLP